MSLAVRKNNLLFQIMICLQVLFSAQDFFFQLFKKPHGVALVAQFFLQTYFVFGHIGVKKASIEISQILKFLKIFIWCFLLSNLLNKKNSVFGKPADSAAVSSAQGWRFASLSWQIPHVHVNTRV